VITGPVTIHATAQGATVSVGSTCQAPGCSVGQGADGAQITTNIITTGTTIRTVDTQQATVALHEYVYKNDFAGFRDKMRFLDRKENQGSLIGSLQSTDDKVRQVPSAFRVPNSRVLVQPVTGACFVFAGSDDSTSYGLCWTAR
jgi:hypothetical protein